jgi:hypothetical protein
LTNPLECGTIRYNERLKIRTSSVMCPNGRILEIRIDLNDVAQGHMTLLVPLPTYFRVSFRINGLDDTIFLDIGLIMCYY